MTIADRTETALHPLEPLAEDEYRQVAATLRNAGKLGGGTVICSVELQEPDHEALASFAASGAPNRASRRCHSSRPRCR